MTEDKTQNVDGAPIYTAPQLLKLELEKLLWLIHGLIPPGLTLLSALPKLMKSYLCLQVLLCIASGKLFPGTSMPPKKAKVVYLSLEDPLAIVRDRIQDLCEALEIDDPPENLLIPDQRGFEDEGKAGKFLKSLLEDFDPKFLVVDTLAAFLPGLPKLSDYLGWHKKILFIRNVLAEKKVSCILIHHARKTTFKETLDPLQAAHGSIGLTAGVDNVCLLSKKGNSRVLYLQGKQVVSTQIGLVFEDGFFHAVNDPTISQLEGYARKVYEQLFKEKIKRSPTEITRLLGEEDRKKTTIHAALQRLVGDGIARRYERGLYDLAPEFRQEERPINLEF